MSYYEKIPSTTHPEIHDWYATNLGELRFSYGRWNTSNDTRESPDWWLKPIEGHVLIEEELKEKMVEFAKWLKHMDNGTTHYDPETKTESDSIGFSPFDCFTDDIMTVEDLYKAYLKLEEDEK